MRDHKVKNVLKKLQSINKHIDPKFKMARYDMEELQSSSTLQLGEWDRDMKKSTVVNWMKEERRKEYWKRRIKASNPMCKSVES
mmetsp:Transcript_690/g.574  ORF Transcript_690/g.574 Transcript_690/m.574 type:complete len:84 (+) Transcript_690:203-454(+)